jgi:hypothetical protein
MEEEYGIMAARGQVGQPLAAGGWDRLLNGWRTLWSLVLQRVQLLRDARLSPQGTRGVPINRGKAPRYKVKGARRYKCSARSEEAGSVTP